MHGGRKNVEVAAVGRQLQARWERLALKCRRAVLGASGGVWEGGLAWCPGGRSTRPELIRTGPRLLQWGGDSSRPQGLTEGGGEVND